MIMRDFKCLDDAEPPLTWWDVIGSVGVFAIVAELVIIARVLL